MLDSTKRKVSVSPKQKGLRERSVDADEMNLSFSRSWAFQVGASVLSA